MRITRGVTRQNYLSLLLNCVLLSIVIFLLAKGDTAKYYLTKTGLINPPETNLPSWYWKNNQNWSSRNHFFETLSQADTNSIIFLGNSLTEAGLWNELFPNLNIKNRGIGGDNTEGVLKRINHIVSIQPKIIFIELGTNDLALGYSTDSISKNYSEIIEKIKTGSPSTKICIQSLIPAYKSIRNNDTIRVMNSKLQSLAKSKNCIYIDLFKLYVNNENELDSKFTFDGLHLNSEGYYIWARVIEVQIKFLFS